MARTLSPDEAALWSRVMASVRPLRAVALPPRPDPKPVRANPLPIRPEPVGTRPAPLKALAAQPAGRASTSSGRVEVARTSHAAANTLDGGWDKRLVRGVVTPDATVDLHGHTLHSAHDLLDAALARAIARGDRVILLVTGRAPRPESERPHARGAIRAAVGDWLAASRHAAHIAAVRAAHPRHGGAGALYLVLRRPRGERS